VVVQWKFSRTGRVALAAVLAVATALVWASPAVAADGDPVTPTTGEVLTMSFAAWTIVQSFVVPLVVGVLTRVAASGPLKVVVQIVVNALGALLGNVVVLDGVAVLSVPTLVMWGLGVAGTVAAHYGVWKPIEVTGSSPATNRLLPAVGIGRGEPLETQSHPG